MHRIYKILPVLGLVLLSACNKADRTPLNNNNARIAEERVTDNVTNQVGQVNATAAATSNAVTQGARDPALRR